LQERAMPFRFRLPFSAELRRNVIALVVISLFVSGLEYFGWLSGLENTALDSFLLAGWSRPSNDIYIVEITEDDYLSRDIFQGRSPLCVAEVRRILTLIERGKPCVIGVDLDTSPSEYEKGNFPKAVWVRDALSDCEQDADLEGTGKDRPSTTRDVRGYLTWPWTRSRATAPHAKGLRRLSFLGGGFKETEESGRVKTEPTSGLSLFPLDRDGVVRRYCATYSSDQADPPSSCKGGLVDSFPKAVLDAYRTAACEKTVRSESRMMFLSDSLLRWLSGKTVRKRSESRKPTHEDEGLILNFSGDRYDFPHMSVRQLKQAAEKPFWSTSSPLQGRIVLLGGAYRAARDLYFTPVGPRHGVEIAAQAIQSELSGGGLQLINHWIALSIDLAAGIGLIWLNRKFHGRFMLLINALFIVVASLLGSYLSFHALAYRFNFTAVLVSIWIHVLWEREAHARKMKDESKSTEKELREVRQERDRSQAELVTVKAERDEYRTKYKALLS